MVPLGGAEARPAWRRSRNQNKVHRRGAEKNKSKVKTGERGGGGGRRGVKAPRYQRLSGLGSRKSSRLIDWFHKSLLKWYRSVGLRPAPLGGEAATKTRFTAEAQRRGEKQKHSQNQRARRWRRTQRGKGPGCQRPTSLGSRKPSRLAKILAVGSAAHYVPVTTPPSTLRTAPLMNDAASEANQT